MAIESSGIKVTADTIKTKLLQDFESYNNFATTEESSFYTNSNLKQFSGKGKKVICYSYKKEGHIAKFCKIQRKNKYGANGEKTLTAKFAEKYDNNDNVWLIDSGAPTHMVNSEESFISLQRFNQNDSVTVANNSEAKVVGIGDVRIQHKTDHKLELLTIKNVLLVPELSINVISVSQLTDKGFEKTQSR